MPIFIYLFIATKATVFLTYLVYIKSCVAILLLLQDVIAVYGDHMQYYCSQVSAFYGCLYWHPVNIYNLDLLIDWLVDWLINSFPMLSWPLKTMLMTSTLESATSSYWKQVFYNQVSMQYTNTWFLIISYEDWFPYEEETKIDKALDSLVTPSPLPLFQYD